MHPVPLVHVPHVPLMCKTQSKLCVFILIYSISIVEEDTETLDKLPEGGVFGGGGGGVGGFCVSRK